MITLFSSSTPGFDAFKWKCYEAFHDIYEILRQYPGCYYAGTEYEKGVWLIATEAVGFLHAVADEFGLEVVDERDPAPELPAIEWPKDMHPYQVTASERALLQGGLLGYLDGGMGKSRIGIEVFKKACPTEGVCLVVCLPVNRYVWAEEIAKWDCAENVQVTDGKTGRDLAAMLEKPLFMPGKRHYIITTHSLVKNLAEACKVDAYDVLVYDEVDLVSNIRTKRHEEWARIRQVNPDAIVFGGTATPFAEDLKNIVGQVSALWPKRFGTFWEFTERYFKTWQGEHGREVGELKEDYVEELQERIEAVSVREPKQKWAYLFPALTVQRVEVDYAPESIQRSVLTAEKDYNKYIRKHAQKRVSATTEWITGCGHKHVTILTHHEDTAKEIHADLQKTGLPAALITGKTQVDERHKIINESLGRTSCYLVCVIKSIGVGVNDLAGFSAFFFAEMSYKIREMIQAMERFYRLNSRSAVTGYFLVLRGTLDGVMLSTLGPKLEEFGKAMEAGTAGKELLEVVKSQETEEAMFARFREIAERGEV